VEEVRKARACDGVERIGWAVYLVPHVQLMANPESARGAHSGCDRGG
jgi:hypothetical protein